jgi:regulator of chromosome condensation
MPPAKRSATKVVASKSNKKQKVMPPPFNTAPTQRLDIYVFGSGEYGELGLGSVKRSGKKPTGVRRPRLNDLLDAKTVGVVQLDVGGMHSIALTHDNRIYTWGVNDNGALGRDTTWEAPEIEIDENPEDSSDEEDDDDTGINPRESTPEAIPLDSFDEGAVFVQVAATDSASFALTNSGRVYGWGTFRVCLD